MNCKACKARLAVTHSHSSDSARASRAVCSACGKVHTLITTVIEGDQRGMGAKAVGARLRTGRARVELHDEVTSADGEFSDGEAE